LAIALTTKPSRPLASSSKITGSKIGAPRAATGLVVRDSAALGGFGAAWGVPQGDLLDINVWLALAVQEHPHHAAARRYWDRVQLDMQMTPSVAPQKIYFCRTTMLGLVRLLCQPKVVGEGALTLDKAWAVYQNFRALPIIDLLADPVGCDAQIQTLLSTQAALPARLWTDAYLAALAQSSGMRLVTFDSDFERFNLPRCTVLVR
jgi:uncharacterized protein